MPLILSNPEADRLARSLAALTGETVEQAVERALRDGLTREQARHPIPPRAGGSEPAGPSDDEDRLLQDVRAIARRFRDHAELPFTSLDHGELLYDEAGLPR